MAIIMAAQIVSDNLEGARAKSIGLVFVGDHGIRPLTHKPAGDANRIIASNAAKILKATFSSRQVDASDLHAKIQVAHGRASMQSP
jgi:hypothetical protein